MVRQNNYSIPHQQQASLVITMSSYDKRALSATDPLPLAHSLINLSYLSSVSPHKFTQIITADGGLVLMIKILNRIFKRQDLLSRISYAAIISCLSNICVRGNHEIRTILFKSNIIPPLINLLEYSVNIIQNSETISNVSMNRHAAMISRPLDFTNNIPNNLNLIQENTIPTANTLNTPEINQQQINQLSLPISDQSDPLIDLCYRIEDVILAIKIIAYLSKYQELRSFLHQKYNKNVFSLVEPFTVPADTYPELRKWSIVCMRNAFKRDYDKMGLRQCGNLNCILWENTYHEFSKCSRCRRVVYCSKKCQRVSWNFHRNWCLLDVSKKTCNVQQDILPQSNHNDHSQSEINQNQSY